MKIGKRNGKNGLKLKLMIDLPFPLCKIVRATIICSYVYTVVCGLLALNFQIKDGFGTFWRKAKVP